MVMGSAVTAQDGLMTPGGYSSLSSPGGKVIIGNGGKEIMVDEYCDPVKRLLQFYLLSIVQDGVYTNLSPQPYLNKPLSDGIRYPFLCSNPCLLPAGFKDMKERWRRKDD